jgi:phosphoglycolate phosphatase
VNLIFDLDGTLIDSRPRLYRLFQQLVPQSHLTFDGYWAFKQKKISNEAILVKEFSFDRVRIDRFVSEWMSKIEAPEFLALDQNFPSMHKTLKRLQSEATLYVCTARQTKEPVIDQLNRLGILSYFEDIMVTEQRKSKVELISLISSLGSRDWIIGDTGLDIQVGRELGIKTCAVLTGFLSEASLRQYMPDLVLDRAADFRFPID